MIELSLAEAQRLAVSGAAPRRLGAEERHRGRPRPRLVQVDPVAAVARAERMVLFSRLGPYDVSELDSGARAGRAVRVLGAHRPELRLRDPPRGDAAIPARRRRTSTLRPRVARGQRRISPLRPRASSGAEARCSHVTSRTARTGASGARVAGTTAKGSGACSTSSGSEARSRSSRARGQRARLGPRLETPPAGRAAMAGARGCPRRGRARASPEGDRTPRRFRVDVRRCSSRR